MHKQTNDKRYGLIECVYTAPLKTIDHNKMVVHYRLKTTDRRNEDIRQKRVNFYIESEGKMDFRDRDYPIVLIC